jgi:hypothetical protein
MKLTSENVTAIFLKCLYETTPEDTSEAVIAEGIVITVGFNPVKLKEHEKDICELLSQLPDAFHQSKGGGYTFLHMCQDKDGEQWTDLHQVQEQLLLLGLAIKKVNYCLPRDVWAALPGGVPYLTVKDLN